MKPLLVIFGFLEFILRIVLTISMGLLMVPLLIIVLEASFGELITPYLWKKL